MDRAAAAKRGGKRLRGECAADVPQREDGPAYEVAIQIGAVIAGGPETIGHERAAGDRRAPAATAIREDRIGHAGRWRAAISRRASCAVALAHIPAIVRARLRKIDLFPDVLA